jgi:hypothetical protein
MFFVRGDARAESNRSCMKRRLEASYFLYTMMHM